MTFAQFVSTMFSNPVVLVTVLLNFGVIIANGWNDAPNAIATCVSTRSMSPRAAIFMAAVFNFLGVLVMTAVNATVATTIYNMVDFSGDQHQALLAVCAAMVAIVVWSCGASLLGLPTSCSHALIAGISGAAIALQGGWHGINGAEWLKVIYGLLLSTAFGFVVGFICVRVINRLFQRAEFRKSERGFGKAEIGAAAAMSFMHGAQDGQKFMGIFLVCLVLAGGGSTEHLVFPLWLMVLCSLLMACGTCIGGMSIIKSVGMRMVHLTKHEGFAADLAAVIILLVCSLLGLPVSTTHTKTTAVMGVGASKRLSAVNWSVAGDMVSNWVLTFPCCGVMGFFMAKLFILWF